MRVAALIGSISLIGCVGLAGCAHPPAARPAALSAPHRPVIVTIPARERTITVTAGPHGPLYTVKLASGSVIVADATLDQLRTTHPDLYRDIEPTLAIDASVDGPCPPTTQSADGKSSGIGYRTAIALAMGRAVNLVTPDLRVRASGFQGSVSVSSLDNFIPRRAGKQQAPEMPFDVGSVPFIGNSNPRLRQPTRWPRPHPPRSFTFDDNTWTTWAYSGPDETAIEWSMFVFISPDDLTLCDPACDSSPSPWWGDAALP